MKRNIVVFVIVAFTFLSGQRSDAATGSIPVFYESSVVFGGGPVLPLSANRTGGYFAVDPQRRELIILNNALNEVKRVVLPSADGAWYNEVASGPDDTVWVSSGYYSKRKIFVQYDGSGNLLRMFYHQNWNMAYVANWGIQVDREGYLYFIYATALSSGGVETWLARLDPSTGDLVSSWRVPIDGGYHWHRGMVINSRGEVLWGNFESRTIYRFSPQTGQTAAFAYLPPESQSNTMSLSIDSDDNLYAVEQPSAFWRYGPSYLYGFDSEGSYRGRREIDFQAAAVGLASFKDEIVLSSYYTGILIKYTSDCKNSVEYPYCVYTLRGVEELTHQYLALARIKDSDGQKILLELKKVAEDLQKNMIESAKNTLNVLIHYVGVKTGRSIADDIGAVYLEILENTRDNL